LLLFFINLIVVYVKSGTDFEGPNAFCVSNSELNCCASVALSRFLVFTCAEACRLGLLFVLALGVPIVLMFWLTPKASSLKGVIF
jgi:hypothetical protein